MWCRGLNSENTVCIVGSLLILFLQTTTCLLDESALGTGTQQNSTDEPIPGGHFRCASGMLVKSEYRCDRHPDCEDGSDEEGCVTFNMPCTDSFYCHETKECVNALWRCDGVSDCTNGEDERGCMTLEHPGCDAGEFVCMLPQDCIQADWVCDGFEDCSNPSDEDNCSVTNNSTATTIVEGAAGETATRDPSRPLADHPTGSREENASDSTSESNAIPQCGANEFRCLTGVCISQVHVCDGAHNCPHGLDEESCASPCDMSNGGCAHRCLPLHGGESRRCECHPGFYLLSDGRTCQDIDECLDSHHSAICSQNCIDMQGAYLCACNHGYQLQPDRRTCKAIGPEPYMVYSRMSEISSASLHGQNERTLVHDLGIIHALDVDATSGDFYWANIASNNIMYYSAITGRESLIIEQPGEIHGIAYDWVAHNLYYTNVQDIAIYACSIATAMCTPLIVDAIEKPHSLVVDPLMGLLFWSDWYEHYPKIEVTWMDGHRRENLISSEIIWPNALTLDLTRQRLYWVDAKLNRIESADYDGEHRHVVLEAILHSFGIATFEDSVIWSDVMSNSLRQANKFTGSQGRVILGGVNQVRIVKVVQPQLQPRGRNYCASDALPCSHICLLRPLGATCKCPPGMSLSAGNKFTCKAAEIPGLYNEEFPYIYGVQCDNGPICENGGTCVNGFSKVHCICPVGFAGSKCDNQTGVFLAYPLLSSNSYAWVAGVLCVLVLTIIGVIFGIYCCKRKRRDHDNEVISIIKFRNALLRGSSSKRSQQVLVDTNSFENPGFAQEEDENANNPKITIAMSSSIESIDSAFMSRRDSIDGDQLSTKPLTNAENYDSS